MAFLLMEFALEEMVPLDPSLFLADPSVGDNFGPPPFNPSVNNLCSEWYLDRGPSEEIFPLSICSGEVGALPENTLYNLTMD